MRDAWRIEHPDDNRGPYRSYIGDVETDEYLDSHVTPAHPMHEGDIPWGSTDGDVHFACDSPQALAAWFAPSERDFCDRWGYVVAHYRVKPEAYWPGNRQVAFDTAAAELGAPYPIKEVLQ